MSPHKDRNQTPSGVEFQGGSKRPRWLRVVLWVVSCLGIWAVGGFVLLCLIYLFTQDSIPALPELDQYNPPLTTRLYDQSGLLIAEFAIERRDVVPANRIPRKLVAAFISSEDDRFFDHRGIDPMGILRAASKNLRAGRIVQGGSTITQQVAKSLIGREKTFTRKFKEAVLALRLEKKFSKEDILYLYLNQIYLGHGSYGVQAAAMNYFHKNVWDLSVSEMATLAGLPQAPSDYDPVLAPQAALERRTYVLSRMREEGFLTRAEEQAANEIKLFAYPITDLFRNHAPYYAEEVRRQLQRKFGTEAVYEGGLTVEIAMDMDWEHAAQRSLNLGLRQLDHRQGFRGPLLNLPDAKKLEAFMSRLQQQLGDKPLPTGKPLPGVVEEVEAQQAKVRVGNHRGILPLKLMRWARPFDPTIHYQSGNAQLQDVRKALKRNDIILVRRIDIDKALAKDPSLRGSIPQEGLLFSLDQIPGVQGALLSLEPRLGYVRAMLGGYDFGDSEFDRVTQSCRQPGSAFKPIHYSLAIESKKITPATVIVDSAVVYDDPENQMRWKPENYEGDFKGMVTVHTALVNSMNVPSIKVLEMAGISETLQWGKKLGITTELKPELGLALGSSCVKLWDLARVYSVFNLGGKKIRFNHIRKVTDRFGRVLLSNASYRDPWQSWDEKFDRAFDYLASPPEQVITPEANFIMTNLMKAVCTSGTGAQARALGKPVAGKTGTTNDSADAWFMAFTHDVVTGVWVGHDTPKDPLGKGENGSRAALPIWVDYMKDILAQRTQEDFEVPPGISFARIDPATGLLAQPDTPNSVIEAFRTDAKPTESVPSKDVVRPDQFFKVDKMF